MLILLLVLLVPVGLLIPLIFLVLLTLLTLLILFITVGTERGRYFRRWPTGEVKVHVPFPGDSNSHSRYNQTEGLFNFREMQSGKVEQTEGETETLTTLRDLDSVLLLHQ